MGSQASSFAVQVAAYAQTHILRSHTRLSVRGLGIRPYMDATTLAPAPRSIADTLEPLWHPVDAGAYLGLHPKTVIKMARNFQLPALRLGKHWRFRASDLTSWAAGQVQSTCQPSE
jgi:excisionase family DNA binding protein